MYDFDEVIGNVIDWWYGTGKRILNAIFGVAYFALIILIAWYSGKTVLQVGNHNPQAHPRFPVVVTVSLNQ